MITDRIMKKYIMTFAALAMVLAACEKPGDNSDFDFGDNFDEVVNPYADGYARLPESVRIATYNVHRCTGPDSDVADYDGLGKALKLMDFDVAAIQELDSVTTRHAEHQIEELASRSGMAFHYCKTINSAGGKYGIGILYRKDLKLLSTAAIDLPGVEPRKALFAEFEDFIFVATHLCHKLADNRKTSVDLINAYLKDNHADYAKPVFLAGDLNAETNSAEIQALLKGWNSLGVTTGTFFNTSYPKRIDYVFEYKGNAPAVEVLGTAVPAYQDISFNLLSDHYPVIVDLKKF